MIKPKYRISKEPAYPPYHPKTTYNIEYKMDCVIDCWNIVEQCDTLEEAEAKLKLYQDME